MNISAISLGMPFKMAEQQLTRERIETAVAQDVAREKHTLQHKIERALEQQKAAQDSSYERVRVRQGQIIDVEV
jgi:hypothetical protein